MKNDESYRRCANDEIWKQNLILMKILASSATKSTIVFEVSLKFPTSLISIGFKWEANT